MKKYIVLLLIGVLALVGVACGATDAKDEEKNAEAESNKEEEGSSVTVTHELGETVVDKDPEKVVVFDFGALDTVDKLGIDVVGVVQTNIPSYLEKFDSEDYDNVGSLKEPDFEKISEIDPDLILISSRQADLYDELSELGPTVYVGVDTTRYMDSFKENVEVIGEIFGKEDEVEEELSKIEESIMALNEKASESDKNGLIILANDDKISAYGSNSRFGLIHDVFGIPAVDDGIEASTHGMNVSFEYVVEQDPDLLYVVDRSAAIGEEPAAKNIVENKLMEDTKAFENDDITYLDPDFWYLSGGGLVSVAEMVAEVEASLSK